MQAALVPKILHLQPPWGIVKARADRGSPMFTEPESQSIRRLQPAVCYRYIFPKRFDLNRVSYYFDHEIGDVVDEENYDDLIGRVTRWQSRWEDGKSRPFLRYRKAFSSIVIEDRRRRKLRTYSYADGKAALYEYCADARTPRDIESAFQGASWVQATLEEFVGEDLMLYMDGRYLSLALPQNRNFELPVGTEYLSVLRVPEPPTRHAPLLQIPTPIVNLVERSEVSD